MAFVNRPPPKVPIPEIAALSRAYQPLVSLKKAGY